jgi:integrase
MPTRDHVVPKYRHYKPKDLAVVRIDGRDYYLGKYNSPESKERCHRFLAEHAVSGRVPPASVKEQSENNADGLTVADLILAYDNHVEAYYVKDGTPTTEVLVIRKALGIVRKLYAETSASDFGPLALRACQEDMIVRGWSRKSINRQIIRIRAMFKWAASRQLLPVTIHQALQTVEPLRKGRTKAKERPPVLQVPDHVIEKTLEHLNPTVAAMARLQRLSGMRPQEVVGLRPTDLDMSDAECWRYAPGRHKGEHNERARTVFLGPRAIAILKPFLHLDISGYIFSPERSESERNARRHAQRKTPLYNSHVAHQERKRKARHRRTLGDHYTVGAFRQAIYRGCAKAFPHPTLSLVPEKELTDDQSAELEAWHKAHQWSPHALRHTAATAIRGRYGIEVTQAVLGHSELRTTQIYGEKNLSAAREVMKEIG